MTKEINLNDLGEDKTLKDLLTFPCSFTFKVMGLADTTLKDKVVAEVQKVIPGDYSPEVKPSSKGKYEAVSITLQAQNIEQIDTLYKTLAEIDGVRMVL